MILTGHEYVDLTPQIIEDRFRMFDDYSKFTFNYKKGEWNYDEPYHHE